MNKHIIRTLALCLLAVVASCGTKKVLTDSQKTAVSESKSGSENSELMQLAFVQKVSDRQLYQKNVVADVSINVKAGSKDMTVPGSLRMRKDEVIRLQVTVPLIGNELARLEFTPSYVLVVDRIHKEYVKADYSELDFLKENGLSFYSLQALFWNQLLLPGSQKVGEGDLHKFSANLESQSSTVPITLTNGKMSYCWNADKTDGRILSAIVDYLSSTHGKSELRWEYSNFKPLGVKMFPAKQQFSFSTSVSGRQQKATVTLEMDALNTNANWEAQSSVSPKYKKVEAKDVFGKIMNM